MSDPMMPMGSGRTAIWFSALAFVISILSFVAASTQTWLTYQHNRLSVMPKLDWREDYGDAVNPRLKITLINAGLGPAMVSDIKITVNNLTLPITNAAACDQLDMRLGVNTDIAKGADCFVMAQDDWIFVKPNDVLVLYHSGDMGQTGIDFTDLDGLGVSARYCSLYDTCENL